MNDANPSESDAYVFPAISNGLAIEVAPNNEFSNPQLAFIAKAKQRSCVAMMITDRGPVLIQDCRHKDDPWVLARPQWVGQDTRNRALFQVAATVVEQRTLAQRVQTLTAKVAALEQDLRALRRGRKEPEPASQP